MATPAGLVMPGWPGGVGAGVLAPPFRLVSLRATQQGFGSPVDQSGNFNDPQLNTTLFPPTWQASQTVAANAYRSPTTPNGYLYKATAGGGGAVGASEPTWPTTIGNTVVDGAITWTCERGPWFTAASGQKHITAIRQALLPASGAYVLPAISWDMSRGDSLVIAMRLAWNFAVDTRTDTTGQILGNRHVSTSRSGFQVQADGGSLNCMRVIVSDGTNTVSSGANSASFARKPVDGSARSFIFMIDGRTKKLNAYSDQIIYQQSDMFDAAHLAPNGLSLAALTGSTATSNNVYLGAVPGNSSVDFGITALDILVARSRGLGSAGQRQKLVNYLATQA